MVFVLRPQPIHILCVITPLRSISPCYTTKGAARRHTNTRAYFLPRRGETRCSMFDDSMYVAEQTTSLAVAITGDDCPLG